MSIETSEIDSTQQAADGLNVAEQAVGRARLVVDEVRATIASALRVLDDAELDSAKARLSERGDFYLGAAGEHLDRLQTRCTDAQHLIHAIYGHLELAAEAVQRVTTMFVNSDTPPLSDSSDLWNLATRISVFDEMVALAKPLSRTATRHLDGACQASRSISRPALLEPVTMERTIAAAGKEFGRADEDVRLLGDVIDRAAASAKDAAGLANEITDNARRRMAGQGRAPVPDCTAPATSRAAR
ncbi:MULTISPECIES: hypothetical protein [Actinomycetes]|jgi:hypothetical protein|uniref:Uncharacterized protein n=1 Tax=Nocardioides currus TaxID=2133958 RepID=A0A2R7YST3_9ACTN|nr:hypothetical protein [Nocardioides currus]PUA79467.1 hypothetical protein C7S10_19035 [Nocardioides currus]